MKSKITARIIMLAAAACAYLLSAAYCRAGMVSLTFDDGLASVYTRALPVLKENHQVATIGITYAFCVYGGSDFMTVKQILALQREGWEVASHGLTHSNPKKIPTLYSQEKLTGWTVVDKKQNIYRAAYAYENVAGILDGTSIMKAAASLDALRQSPGSYYFDERRGQLYVRPAGDVRYGKPAVRAISSQREIEYSQKELEKLGFSIKTYITPYNTWPAELGELGEPLYACVASGGERANWKDGFDPHRIGRFVVREDDKVSSLKKLVKRYAIENDGWVVFCFHGIGDDTGWEPWPLEKFEEFSGWLAEKGVKTVTISQGAALFASSAAGKPAAGSRTDSSDFDSDAGDDLDP
jgi:peptidoglycan/xylan/chitin deacetylase (PgdA/CDA1 family)